jgi:hypothetical protein
LILVALSIWVLESVALQSASVYVTSTSPFTVELKEGGIDTDSLAFGTFDPVVNSTGWNELYVSSNGKQQSKWQPWQQGFGLGYLEGYFSGPFIWDSYQNYVVSNNLPNATLPPKVATFVQDQHLWMTRQITAHPTDHYWIHVQTLLSHVDGMYAGYLAQASAETNLTWLQIYTLTMGGDLEDLLSALADIEKPRAATVKTPPYPMSYHMDCSGLVKLQNDFKDLHVGHTTFNGYSYMLRIFKHYEMPLQKYGGYASKVSFSSRPGDLESKDDFYIMNSGLAVIETSLTTFNRTLYQSLKPETVPNWIRCQVANRMSSRGREWWHLFARHNSGTHNNQWIVTDYKLFKAGEKKLNQDLVWMIEQMGPYMDAADVTADLLAKNFIVPSFNIPYFPKIFNVSGYRDHGFNYTTDIRHQIFMRDHHNVVSLETMGWLMNSNDYKNDPLSGGNACNAISARCDLSSTSAFGGIDAKAVNSTYMSLHLVYAISSPTHQTQPPFAWTSEFDSSPHTGMPITWNFTWQTFGVPSMEELLKL